MEITLSGPWDDTIVDLEVLVAKLESGFGREDGPLNAVGQRFRMDTGLQFMTKGTHLSDEWAPVKVGENDEDGNYIPGPADYRAWNLQVESQEVPTAHYTQESRYDPITDPMLWTGDLYRSFAVLGAPGNIAAIEPFSAIFGSDVSYAANSEFGGPGDKWGHNPRPIITEESGGGILPKLEDSLFQAFDEALSAYLPVLSNT